MKLSFNHNNNRRFNLYALIDRALRIDCYLSLLQLDKICCQSLLVKNFDNLLSTIGSVLVKLKTDIYFCLFQYWSSIKQNTKRQLGYKPPYLLRNYLVHSINNVMLKKKKNNQHFFRYYDQQCFPELLHIANKNPYYVDTMSKIHRAI